MDRNLTVNEQHELRVLELVEERDKITQRGVATELEIALGMANALIKRLVLKGYIKVKDAPSRRYKYYITPEGFIEKGRLVSRYIANSFKFFGEVRRDYEMLANQVAASQASANQGTGVCFVGTGEVMEIAQMVFAAHNIEVVCVLDVLSDEGEQHFRILGTFQMRSRAKSDALSSQKLGVPTRFLKFWRRPRVAKRFWCQHL